MVQSFFKSMIWLILLLIAVGLLLHLMIRYGILGGLATKVSQWATPSVAAEVG